MASALDYKKLPSQINAKQTVNRDAAIGLRNQIEQASGTEPPKF